MPSIIGFEGNFGGLNQMNPVSTLSRGIETWKLIKGLGYEPREKTFFEVGTGWVPTVPVAYWLMGAKKTITIDLNPCLKAELTRESFQFISDNKEEILKLFGSLMYGNRLDDLLHFNRSASFSTSAFLDLCCINYIAPGDAGSTALPPRSIDCRTSCLVFQHIPPEVLKKIIGEGNRIVEDSGLFIHRINYRLLSAINFLQFSEMNGKNMLEIDICT
jgi:hypothetical protein